MPKGEAATATPVKQTVKKRVGDGTPGPGRPKGVPNKTTTSMRQAWLDAFEKLGGVDSLVRWGQTNPDDFYKCATKLIPQDITSGDKPLLLTATERDARIAALLGARAADG